MIAEMVFRSQTLFCSKRNQEEPDSAEPLKLHLLRGALWRRPGQSSTGGGVDASTCHRLLLLWVLDQRLCSSTACVETLQHLLLPPPTHTAASCVSADAPTLMWERRQPWESTPTLLRLLKIARAHRLDWSRSGGDGARSAAQTWSVGDVTMADEDSASPAPYLEIRKLLQFRFPSARKRTQRSGAALNHRTVKR